MDIKSTVRDRYVNMKFKVKNDVKDCLIWCQNNPELAVLIAGGAISVIRYGGKNLIKYINASKAEAVKNLYCYDRSLGHYWALKRELTNSEWLIIDARKHSGERLADILADMKVLK